MIPDVSIPAAEGHPVAIALNDPDVLTRLGAAARAFLGGRCSQLTLTQRTAEVQVITQEAASRAWEHRDRFDSSKNVVSWLVGFVRNVAREFAKQRGRDPTGPPEDGRGLDIVAVDPSRPVDEAVADKLLASQLLEQLSAIDQAIVSMKYSEDLTCAEIGQRVGLAENAVRVRVFRVTKKLKGWCGVTGEGQS